MQANLVCWIGVPWYFPNLTSLGGTHPIFLQFPPHPSDSFGLVPDQVHFFSVAAVGISVDNPGKVHYFLSPEEDDRL